MLIKQTPWFTHKIILCNLPLCSFTFCFVDWVFRDALKQFIEGDLSHREFIERNEDSYYVLEDVENSEIINRSITFFKDIPQSYKPAKNFFLRKSDAVDLDLIIDAFSLSEDLQPASIIDKVKELSAVKNRETFNLHLQSGIGVGYGTIVTETLGRTLLSFDGFYKNVALDHIKVKTEVDTGDRRKAKIQLFL